jgi:hypothetical protein
VGGWSRNCQERALCDGSVTKRRSRADVGISPKSPQGSHHSEFSTYNARFFPQLSGHLYRTPTSHPLAMSFALRAVSNNSRLISRLTRPTGTVIRPFHTPFAVSGKSTLTSPPPTTPTVSSSSYEKQLDHTPEPVETPSGTRTYVVSEPDASTKYYSVPSGAYPTSDPYVNFTATEAPNTHGAQVSSTSSTPLAHEQTTRTVDQHPGGVGASSDVRHVQAPGEMGERGGSYGGQGLLDKEGTVPGKGSGDRNPPPDGDLAENFSKKGIKDAWKERK